MPSLIPISSGRGHARAPCRCAAAIRSYLLTPDPSSQSLVRSLAPIPRSYQVVDMLEHQPMIGLTEGYPAPTEPRLSHASVEFDGVGFAYEGSGPWLLSELPL